MYVHNIIIIIITLYGKQCAQMYMQAICHTHVKLFSSLKSIPPRTVSVHCTDLRCENLPVGPDAIFKFIEVLGLSLVCLVGIYGSPHKFNEI